MPTCDVCGEPADVAVAQPTVTVVIAQLCAYHLARFALDNLAGRED